MAGWFFGDFLSFLKKEEKCALVFTCRDIACSVIRAGVFGGSSVKFEEAERERSDDSGEKESLCQGYVRRSFASSRRREGRRHTQKYPVTWYR